MFPAFGRETTAVIFWVTAKSSNITAVFVWLVIVSAAPFVIPSEQLGGNLKKDGILSQSPNRDFGDRLHEGMTNVENQK
jgi:hypothetical protein